MKFDILQKPPPDDDQKGWYRWYYKVCELLNGLSFARFLTTVTAPAHEEGLVFYDGTDHSLCYYNDADGVTVNLGREMLVRVYNNTGADIANGSVVYINGANTGWPTVKLAKADTKTDSQSTLGVATNTIANSSYGYVCTAGIVHDLDTSSYSTGAVLYLSAVTAGGVVATPPLQPNYEVEVGTVVASSATAGQIFVHVDKSAWHPSLELLDTSATVTLPTTATVYKPPTTVKAEGFTYSPSTGIFIFNESDSYGLTLLVNAEPSNPNYYLYFYIEVSSDGSSWSKIQYSGRQLKLLNAEQTQVVISGEKYFPKGTQMRFYLWASNTVTLKTSLLDSLTDVYIPAFRMMIA